MKADLILISIVAWTVLGAETLLLDTSTPGEKNADFTFIRRLRLLPIPRFGSNSLAAHSIRQASARAGAGRFLRLVCEDAHDFAHFFLIFFLLPSSSGISVSSKSTGRIGGP